MLAQIYSLNQAYLQRLIVNQSTFFAQIQGQPDASAERLASSMLSECEKDYEHLLRKTLSNLHAVYPEAFPNGAPVTDAPDGVSGDAESIEQLLKRIFS